MWKTVKSSKYTHSISLVVVPFTKTNITMYMKISNISARLALAKITCCRAVKAMFSARALL